MTVNENVFGVDGRVGEHRHRWFYYEDGDHDVPPICDLPDVYEPGHWLSDGIAVCVTCGGQSWWPWGPITKDSPPVEQLAERVIGPTAAAAPSRSEENT